RRLRSSTACCAPSHHSLRDRQCPDPGGRGTLAVMTVIPTRLTETYGVIHPIAQAGMAFVGMTADLAVAVCEAGGLGSLGVGLMPPPALAMTIKAIRAGTGRPFNVNF